MLDERRPRVDEGADQIRAGRREEQREHELDKRISFRFQRSGVDEGVVARARRKVRVRGVLQLRRVRVIQGGSRCLL